MPYQFAGCRNNLFFVHLFLSVLFLLSFQLRSHASESVVLSWNAGNRAITGFTVYYGTSSHDYSSTLTVGDTNRAVISGLTFGATYYFAVSETDILGHQSALSSETSFVAGSATLTSANLGGQQMTITLQGSPGQTYIIQSSTDFINWIPCYTNTAPYQYSFAINQATPRLAFRACRWR
jgi:hypothetical protein